MTRHERREPVARAEGAGGPRRAGPARERGELAVRDDLPARNRAQLLRERTLERRRTVEIDGHVGYYCAGMNKQATVVVHGNGGPGLAEGLRRRLRAADTIVAVSDHEVALLLPETAGDRVPLVLTRLAEAVNATTEAAPTADALQEALLVLIDDVDAASQMIYAAARIAPRRAPPVASGSMVRVFVGPPPLEMRGEGP